jgi:hypothetical protein
MTSKILLNPYRNNLSIAGLTLKHDEWLNQGVRTDSEVIHKSLTVQNLYATDQIIFTGNITEVETQHLLITDNIIDINAGNVNPLLNAGFAIRRGGPLPPYQLLYSETDQLFRMGFPTNMQVVATREDVPTDGYISVWNASQSKFVTTNTLSVPINFGSGYFTDSVVFGTFTNAPKIYGSASDLNLYLESSNDIIFNRGTNFIFPIGKILKFGADTTIQANPLVGLDVSTPRINFSNNARLLWGATGSIYTTNSGNNVNIDGTMLNVGSGTLSLSAGTVLSHQVVTFQPTTNNSYTINSQGNLYLTANGNAAIVVSKLSINNKGTFTTDAFNNMSVDCTGDIFISPLNKVLINQNKSLCFINDNLGIKGDPATGNLYLFSDRGITLTSTNGVYLPIGVPLNIANYTVISELPNGESRISSSSNHIQLVPGPNKNVKIPLSTNLQFANDEVIVSDGINLSIVATSQIQFSAPLGLNIPKGIPMNFGDLYHRIYQDVSSNVTIESTQNIILNAFETVSIIGNTLNIAGSLIFKDTDSALTLKSPLGTTFIKTENSFRITNDTLATSFYNSSFSTLGGIYVSKNLVVSGTSQFSGQLSVSNVLTVTDLGIPIKIQNSSVSDGTAISIVSSWDNSSNYTVGRGTTGLNGGRSLVFTVPLYAEYGGTGSKPGFFFGSNVGNEYLFVSDSATRISQGTVTIMDTSNNALTVQGRINMSSMYTNDNTTFTLNSMGMNVAVPTTISNNFTVKNASGTTNILSVTPNSIISIANHTIAGNMNISGNATIGGIINSINGMNVSGTIDMNNQVIKNLQSPTFDNDAASKYYVDSVARGLTNKMAVSAASTGDVDITQQLTTLDGVILSQYGRVLLKDICYRYGIYTRKI